jgi:hypothetical protein
MQTITIGNRQSYKFTKVLMNMIQDVGAIIFGGAVRDSIVHDYVAQQFYDAIKKDEEGMSLYALFEHGIIGYEDIPMERDAISELYNNSELYQDPECMPSLKDRFLIPNDIDCFMETRTKDLLIKNLKKEKGFSTRIVIEGPLDIYRIHIDTNIEGLEFTRLEIKLVPNHHLKEFIKYIGKTKYQIDIISRDSIIGISPPFGKVDFECNSLLLNNNNNISLSPLLTRYNSPLDSFEMLKRIINDIYQKKTTAVQKASYLRTHKMMQKGWTLIHQTDTVDIILTNKPKEKIIPECCTICHDDFENSEYRITRNCCASGIYHIACWEKTVDASRSKTCPLCRKHLDIEEYVIDRNIEFW